MRLHRFYIGSETPDHIANEELVHQWRNVFRMKTGEGAILFGNDGVEHTCALEAIDKKSATWKIESSKVGLRTSHSLILGAALVKKDNFDLIIRQATEIGVTHILPLISERSEKKGLNMDRARRILIEASEQCGRVDIPMIDEPRELREVLADVNADIISLDPTGESLAGFKSPKTPAIFIGPEGGWSPRETELLMSKGPLYSLPTFVLRAETAAAVALGIVKSRI